MTKAAGQTLGNKLAPPRFVLFVVVLIAVSGAACALGAKTYGDALVIGFDLAALVFIVSLWPIMRSHSADLMRKHAAENDARRGLVLVLTGVVSLALLAAIVAELPDAKGGDPWAIVKLVGTLALSWIYTNLVFMLHYAHLHYGVAPDGQAGQKTRDHGGFEFPGTKEPDYWDFLYFAFTAGMSFAASDVDVTRGAVRRIVVLHSALSFVFNIGVLAFSINVLAGAAG